MVASPSKLQRDAARNLVTKYLKVRAGEHAIVESWDHTLPMARAMVDELRRAGGRVLFFHEDEEAWWRAIDRKQSKLLGHVNAPEWAALKAADVYVMFWGPGDTDRLERMPERTFEQALDWNSFWYEAAREAGLRGGRMTAGFVTEGRARKWGLNAAQWEERMLRACLVDPDEMARSGARLAKALAQGTRVRITHPNGTDLELGLGRKPPRTMVGQPRPWTKGASPTGMLEQLPAGRVDIALDSRTAEGTFRANRRTNIWWTSHTGGTLTFTHGTLTAFAFDEGGVDFAREFKRGTAGKDRTGALTVGLNPAASDVPNLETIECGSAALTLGRNGHLGGVNRSNFMSWVVLAGAEIAVDGTPVVRGGRIL